MKVRQKIFRVIFAGLLGLGVVRGAAAQNAGVVTGTVVYADTGKVASGVTVWLTTAKVKLGPLVDPKTGEFVLRDADYAERKLYTVVSADGTFTIDDVSPGTYVVHTSSRTYVSPDDTIYPTSNSEHVATGPQVGDGALLVEVTASHLGQHLAIVLRRGGVIEGVVHGAEGAQRIDAGGPPQGFSVGVERKLDANHYARVGGAAHTDELGHYRLEGLGPGDYVVLAARPITMVHAMDGNLTGGSGLLVYAPHTVRPSEARVVHVSGAETQLVDIDLPRGVSVHRVEGTVDLREDELLRTTFVRLYPSGEGGLTASCPVGVGKSFSFGDVPDGEYTISVEIPPTQEFVRVDVADGTLHMRLLKPTYVETSVSLHVTGRDVLGIVLRPLRAGAAK